MKKNFARIIALIVAILMVAALFAGCKSDKDDKDDKDDKETTTKLEGTYKIKKIDGKDVTEYFTEQAETMDMTLDEFCGRMNISVKDLGSLITFNFKEDGTVTAANSITGESYDLTVTYDGNTFTATDEDGETRTGTINGKTFDMDFDGTMMTFGK